MKTKAQIIKTVATATERMDIHLMALGAITSTHSEKYYSEIEGEDIPHNIKTLFSDLRTVMSLLQEEHEKMREHRRVLESVNIPLHPIDVDGLYEHSAPPKKHP